MPSHCSSITYKQNSSHTLKCLSPSCVSSLLPFLLHLSLPSRCMNPLHFLPTSGCLHMILPLPGSLSHTLCTVHILRPSAHGAFPGKPPTNPRGGQSSLSKSSQHLGFLFHGFVTIGVIIYLSSCLTFVHIIRSISCLSSHCGISSVKGSVLRCKQEAPAWHGLLPSSSDASSHRTRSLPGQGNYLSKTMHSF